MQEISELLLPMKKQKIGLLTKLLFYDKLEKKKLNGVLFQFNSKVEIFKITKKIERKRKTDWSKITLKVKKEKRKI